MNDHDTTDWMPCVREKVMLEGVGRRGDFASVQSVVHSTKDCVFLTGGWTFEKIDGEWRTPSSTEILMRRAPHLDQSAAMPSTGKNS